MFQIGKMYLLRSPTEARTNQQGVAMPTRKPLSTLQAKCSAMSTASGSVLLQSRQRNPKANPMKGMAVSLCSWGAVKIPVKESDSSWAGGSRQHVLVRPGPRRFRSGRMVQGQRLNEDTGAMDNPRLALKRPAYVKREECSGEKRRRAAQEAQRPKNPENKSWHN